MVGRGPAGTDWFGRIFAPCFSAALSLICAGVVVYFSGQRAAIDSLQAQIASAATEIAVLKRTMDFNGDRIRRLEDGRPERVERRR